jgi:hypothetical protein
MLLMLRGFDMDLIKFGVLTCTKLMEEWFIQVKRTDRVWKKSGLFNTFRVCLHCS